MIVGPTIILITDPRVSLERTAWVIEQAASIVPAGELLVQLRDKTAAIEELQRAARTLRSVTTRVGASFVVNAPDAERMRLAQEIGADGVHVPVREAAHARGWFSTPAHDGDDVAVAARAGAAAVLVSPIFDSPGKGQPRGVEALTRARSLAGTTRVYALGGIDASRAAACREAGANGVAVIRALLDANDPAQSARSLYAPFRRTEPR